MVYVRTRDTSDSDTAEADLYSERSVLMGGLELPLIIAGSKYIEDTM